MTEFDKWFDATFKKDFTFIDGARSWAKAGWDAARQSNKHTEVLSQEADSNLLRMMVNGTSMEQLTQNTEKK